jgi:2-polyprenyl-3-methyl-5-hydroxy-6-metoxy-1,4-benzoquinol methylase
MTELNLTQCPVCGSGRSRYARTVMNCRLVRCSDCSFLYSNPQPSAAALSSIYGTDYFCGADDPKLEQQMRQIKGATASRYLKRLANYGVTGGSLLEVGCGHGDQLVAAEEAGFDVTGVEFSPFAAERAKARLRHGQVLVGELHSVDLGAKLYDVCILADVIEHVRDPRDCLQHVWSRLKPGGCILVATPSLDSWSARLMGGRWMEFKPEHLSYFSRRTLESLLWQSGFQQLHFEPGVKCVTLSYVNEHFTRYPSGLWTSMVNATARLLPRWWRDRPMELAGSGILAIGVKGARRTAAPRFHRGTGVQ